MEKLVSRLPLRAVGKLLLRAEEKRNQQRDPETDKKRDGLGLGRVRCFGIHHGRRNQRRHSHGDGVGLDGE